MSAARGPILLTGRGGQVGGELLPLLAALGEVVALDREELDLADPDAIRRTVRTLRPTLIVNPAAYTAVDRAESEPALAEAINATAPGVLAEEAKRLGALLVHYSTDYVFDGRKHAPYSEDDEPRPLSVYGRTKLAGEQAVQAAGGRHLILRTSWVYGPYGHNFLRTMLRLAAEREELRVVADQHGAPTWSRLLARATVRALGRGAEGLYHLTAAGATTWYDFARAILRGRDGLAVRRVLPIPTAEYPTPAHRPTYSVLSTEKLRRETGIALPGWEHSLREVLALL